MTTVLFVSVLYPAINKLLVDISDTEKNIFLKELIFIFYIVFFDIYVCDAFFLKNDKLKCVEKNS